MQSYSGKQQSENLVLSFTSCIYFGFNVDYTFCVGQEDGMFRYTWLSSVVADQFTPMC